MNSGPAPRPGEWVMLPFGEDAPLWFGEGDAVREVDCLVGSFSSKD